VTVKVQGEPVVGVQVTVVVPTEKDVPDAGLQVTVPHPAPPGVAKVAIAPHCPGSFGIVMFAGHVSAHALTITRKLQTPPLFSEHVTVVVPTGKQEPDGGVHVIIPQLPVVPGKE
jgi:hypothetical protein